MKEAYQSLKYAAYPWLVRCWAEAKGKNGKPLVELKKQVMHDVCHNYTEMEAHRLQLLITRLKEEKRDHVSTIIHE